MTPLKGADGKVYALAQGNLISSGFGAEGADGSRITVNVPSAARIPNGATVERTVPNPFASGSNLVLNLHSADFTTATRLSQAINHTLGSGVAKPLDATSIEVEAPEDAAQRVEFISLLENLTLEPGAASARVIVNSRTGTVVIGSQVRVKPAAVAHGNLIVTISENPQVSQPQPLSAGVTAVVPNSEVSITEQDKRMFLFDPGVSLDEIVRAVNQVGAAPGDLVAILEALKQAGALQAKLIVI
jgi:flagellar P-ring protein precursor FlgI